jgi:hypothetical protein
MADTLVRPRPRSDCTYVVNDTRNGWLSKCVTVLPLRRYSWAPDKVLLQPPSQPVNYSKACSKSQKSSTMKKIFKKITQRRKLVTVKSLDNRQPQTDVLSNRSPPNPHYVGLAIFLLVNDNLICVIQLRVPLQLHRTFVCRISQVMSLIAW